MAANKEKRKKEFKNKYYELYGEFYGVAKELLLDFAEQQFELMENGYRGSSIGDNTFTVWKNCGWEIYSSAGV